MCIRRAQPSLCADVVCRAVAEHQVQGWVVPHHGRRSRHEGRVRMNATGLLRHLHLLCHQLRSLCSGLYRLDGCCCIAKSALACSCPCDQPQPQRPVCTGLPSPPGRGCVGGAPGGRSLTSLPLHHPGTINWWSSPLRTRSSAASSSTATRSLLSRSSCRAACCRDCEATFLVY